MILRNMNTNNYRKADGCLGLFLGSLLCFNILAQLDIMPWNSKPRGPTYTPPKEHVDHHTSNINSGQRALKSLRVPIVETEYQTIEVSQWVTSGDWSQDNYPLTITIPIQKITNDNEIDYVEDHWDDYLDDPEDELRFHPDIFQ